MKVSLQCPDCGNKLRPATASRVEEKLVLRTCCSCGESFEVTVSRTNLFITCKKAATVSIPCIKPRVWYSKLTRRYREASPAGAPRYRNPRMFISAPRHGREADKGIEVRRECGSITWLSHGQLSSKLACAKKGSARAHETCQVKPRQVARRRLRADKYDHLS